MLNPASCQSARQIARSSVLHKWRRSSIKRKTTFRKKFPFSLFQRPFISFEAFSSGSLLRDGRRRPSSIDRIVSFGQSSQLLRVTRLTVASPRRQYSSPPCFFFFFCSLEQKVSMTACSRRVSILKRSIARTMINRRPFIAIPAPPVHENREFFHSRVCEISETGITLRSSNR